MIEDDYDAEYRYDREPVGSLQGLAPERVAYGGTASKTLAPALRLGWLAVPAWLAEPLRGREAARRRRLAGARPARATPTCSAAATSTATCAARGSAYRRRRDALAAALAAELPQARVQGVAAGLHAVVGLPGDVDEARVVELARERGLAVEPAAPHRFEPAAGSPALLLGYARLSEPAIEAAVRELAAAVRAAAPRARHAKGPGRGAGPFAGGLRDPSRRGA